MATKAQVSLHPSATRTANGNGSTQAGLAQTARLRVQLNVTAASGTTPTLDVVIEDSLDGTNWNTIGTFTQKVTTGRQVIDITTPFADTVRARWTIGGTTPSFTFAVDAIGVA